MHKLRNWQLFAICVLTWSTTWHAITYQIGVTSPEFGVAVRFALAGVTALGWCLWQRTPLRFGWRDHGWFALQGVFMYGVSYVCVYHAEQHVPSGLVAVGYSGSPLIGGIGAALLFGTAMSRRFVWGGVLCVAGVALIFWPEFGQASGSASASLGAVYTMVSVLLATVGALAASRNRKRAMPLWPSMGFGMLYGAASSLLVVIATGQPVAFPAVTSWWVALFYLALAGSVMTFACYLTLLERLGAGPAGTVGVMTPLLALGVSMAFENYRPDVLTAAGVALAVWGNVLILRPTGAPGAVKAVVAAE